MLHGREYTIHNLVAFQRINENNTTALSIGSTTRPHDIGQANEDSVGIVVGEDYFLGIVCDSHFGGTFNQELVDSYTKNFQRSVIKDFSEFQEFVLDQIVYTCNLEVILNGNPIGELGETALLIVLRCDNNVYWANIGDSMLYLFDQNDGELLSVDTHSYLGPHFLPQLTDIAWGQKVIKKGNIIMLVTDGLPGIYGAPPPNANELAPLISGTSNNILKNIVEYAFGKGGEDNIAIIVSQY